MNAGAITRTVALAALLLGAACDGTGSPAEPALGGPRMGGKTTGEGSQLTSWVTSRTYDYYARTLPGAAGGAGRIDFGGYAELGNPCYALSATQTAARGVATLTVTATPTADRCTTVTTFHNYTGAITNVAPGTYLFQVVHDVGGPRVTVYSAEVVVGSL